MHPGMNDRDQHVVCQSGRATQPVMHAKELANPAPAAVNLRCIHPWALCPPLRPPSCIVNPLELPTVALLLRRSPHVGEIASRSCANPLRHLRNLRLVLVGGLTVCAHRATSFVGGGLGHHKKPIDLATAMVPRGPPVFRQLSCIQHKCCITSASRSCRRSCSEHWDRLRALKPASTAWTPPESVSPRPRPACLYATTLVRQLT